MMNLFPDSVLLVFCKAPIAGQVKTRLQPSLTPEQAVDAHIQLTHMTLRRAVQQPLCDVQLYCAPDTGHPFFQQCAEQYSLTLMQQQGDDLGARMHHAFVTALSCYRHVVLIGCDCPSLSVEDLRQALNVLQNDCDAVIAPAEDGGYVLIGLNAASPLLFETMTWGSDVVMAETRRKAASASLVMHELTMQWDVDTAEDWAWLNYLDSLKPVLL